MCGIFGATNREKYLSLQKLNLSRGDFAQSTMFIDREGYEIHKVPLKGAATKYRFPKKKKFDYYLGHVQAPTSVVREFTSNTSHPFFVENWIVAHNGVLTNFKELVNSFEMPYDNPVDSSIIPFILFKLQSLASNDGEIDLIVQTLSMLKGTFGVWIHNTHTANTFLAKCGVTLYGDIYENTFSSIKTDDLTQLEDGILYQITREGLTTVASFDCDNPFFLI
jgi:glucosamine 6-phosphate synthetase-like amidotransferase/phosphosugar isomerase protein